MPLSRTRPGSPRVTIRRSRRPRKTIAPWRCRCWSTGCRDGGTSADDSAVTVRRIALKSLEQGIVFQTAGSSLRPSGGVQIQIDPDGNMVGRLLPAADMAIDPHPAAPLAGLRRQQQLIDPQSVVLLPGAGLIIPEGVFPRGIRHRS